MRPGSPRRSGRRLKGHIYSSNQVAKWTLVCGTRAAQLLISQPAAGAAAEKGNARQKQKWSRQIADHIKQQRAGRRQTKLKHRAYALGHPPHRAETERAKSATGKKRNLIIAKRVCLRRKRDVCDGKNHTHNSITRYTLCLSSNVSSSWTMFGCFSLKQNKRSHC